ncbi:hypothetical protein MRX96_045074 [Rhipicephalus microplus]
MQSGYQSPDASATTTWPHPAPVPRSGTRPTWRAPSWWFSHSDRACRGVCQTPVYGRQRTWYQCANVSLQPIYGSPTSYCFAHCFWTSPSRITSCGNCCRAGCHFRPPLKEPCPEHHQKTLVQVPCRNSKPRCLLKPATPPDPPEQTDTTVTFFEEGQANVDSFLTTTYGTNSGVLRAHTGKIQLTAYGPDQNLVNAVQNDVFNLKGIYIRLIANWDPSSLQPFFDEVSLTLVGGLFLELHAADIPKITQGHRGYVKFMVVVPPGVTQESLAKLKVATLANPLRIMNNTIKEAVKDLAKSKICAAFTMSALKSMSAQGEISNPGDPADLVSSVKQAEVSAEDIRVSVLDDNCPNFNMLKIMKMVFDKNFK